MAFGFGDRSDLVHELDRGHEALELVPLGQPHVTLGILHRPTIDLLQELADFMAREWGSAGLALDAMPLVEGLGLWPHDEDRIPSPRSGRRLGRGREAELSVGRMITPAGRAQSALFRAASS